MSYFAVVPSETFPTFDQKEYYVPALSALLAVWLIAAAYVDAIALLPEDRAWHRRHRPHNHQGQAAQEGYLGL